MAIRGIKIEMMSYFSPRGPPQNLGFSREQLGRFKHPRPEKANESLNVFYCVRQDRRIRLFGEDIAYDDYIESSPRPNQLARGLSLRGLACLPKTLIQHRINSKQPTHVRPVTRFALRVAARQAPVGVTNSPSTPG